METAPDIRFFAGLGQKAGCGARGVGSSLSNVRMIRIALFSKYLLVYLLIMILQYSQ